MSEWKTCTLNEIVDFGNGKARPKTEGNIAIYGGNGVLGFSGDSNYSGETIIIGRVGAYCGATYYESDPIWVSDNALSAKAKEGFIPKYAYYVLKSKNLNQYAQGSSHPLLTQGLLNKIDAYVTTNQDIQKKIVSIIGGLEEKIAVNKQTIQTLENIAQAIFKSWFVDFDPTCAKVAARENGQDPELAAMAAIAGKEVDDLNSLGSEQIEKLKSTAALFPDNLIDSELGQIPEGWEIKPINDWGDVVCGKTPPKKDPGNYGGGIPFIKIPDMHGNVFVTRTSDSLTLKGSDTQKKKQIPKGSVCVSCIATVGQVVISSETSHTNQQINSIVPHDESFTPFLYFSMLEKNKLLHDLASGGSATLNLNTGNFSKVLLTYPGEDLLAKYSDVVSPQLEGILELARQTISLSNIRDSLLPKLLSGELEVASAN